MYTYKPSHELETKNSWFAPYQHLYRYVAF